METVNTQAVSNGDQENEWNLDINFDEIDEDLSAFQEDEMVQQALHRGVDLKKYGKELEQDLRQVELESVAQYVENSQQVTDLHRKMQECDGVLARMEEMLHGFQADLGEISAEIKHLQDDSLSMSIRLKNRRATESILNRFIDNSSIVPSMASAVVSSNINEAFLDAVIALSQKLNYLEQTNPANDGSSLDLAPADTFCGRSMLPELERLRVKAVAKIRDYFTAQFAAIRKPKTNIQMMQTNSLVKYAKLFQFVQKESPVVADDLRSMYIESMGRTLLNLFKSYYMQLSKLDQVMATKSDMIAVEEATLKSLFTQKVDFTKRSDSFALGDRDKVLEQIECAPIMVHVAMAEGTKYPYEVLLRSVLKHLIDAASNEFLFIIDFFRTSPRDTFNRIFGRTLSLILENIENYLLTCNDAVGLLIMIKMTHSMRMVMQRRRIPVLDSLFDRVSMLLWPRFKFVFDANLKSIRTANARKLGPIDVSHHYVCRRYAGLISSVITLQTSNGASASSSSPTSSESVTDKLTGSNTQSLSGEGGGDGNIGGPTDFGVGGGGENMIQHDVVLMRTEMIGENICN